RASIDMSLCSGRRMTLGGFETRAVRAPQPKGFETRALRAPQPAKGAQQQPAPSAAVEHTPVAGRVSSTAFVARISPARYATIERTCSWPVASKNVGARP